MSDCLVKEMDDDDGCNDDEDDDDAGIGIGTCGDWLRLWLCEELIFKSEDKPRSDNGDVIRPSICSPSVSVFPLKLDFSPSTLTFWSSLLVTLPSNDA